MKKELKDAASSAMLGTVFIVGAIWFWHYFIGTSFDEFALISRGHTTDGLIVDTWEDAESGDEGGTHWFHGATYTYRIPDGREFIQHTKDKSGRLRSDLRDLDQPFPIEVEYLPDDPLVSRIKGDGSPSIFDWLWRKMGLGILLLAMFLAPGIGLLSGAIRYFMRSRQM